MTVTIVVGGQFGDEGKGRVVDNLVQKGYKNVVRYNGANNAGHTVVSGKNVYKLNIHPSIVEEDGTAIIANGVLVDPEALLDNISEIERHGRSPKLYISDRAHVIMPYDIKFDGLLEKIKGEGAAKSTGKGVSPGYMDKAAKIGIRFSDLTKPEVLKAKLDTNCSFYNGLFESLGDEERFDADKIYEKYLNYGEKFKGNITDTSIMINEMIDNGENVLFEGAQATFLDIDHGIYPYGTASSCVAGGACTGAGVGPGVIDEVIITVKAYTSRVGGGPFLTEQDNEIGDCLREKGYEYGTTTGRARRCGWLDMNMVRDAVRFNRGKTTKLAITKLDVLGGLGKIKVCIGYELDDKIIKNVPVVEDLRRCKPIYKEFDGWADLTEKEWLEIAKGKGKIPKKMEEYLDFICKETETEIYMISVGADREAAIIF